MRARINTAACITEPIFSTICVEIFHLTSSHIGFFDTVILVKCYFGDFTRQERFKLCLINGFTLLLAKDPAVEHFIGVSIDENILSGGYFVVI